ncbi:MAG: hypothetical protein V1696_01550, partial [Candidatus Jorgensenbacteria bacterium]
GGRRREKNARKFFGFCTRESASVSEARIIGHQDSIQNTFELRSIHTASWKMSLLARPEFVEGLASHFALY